MAHTDPSTHCSDEKEEYCDRGQGAWISDAATTSGQISDEQRTPWQNVEKYRKVTFITLGLTSAILLFGYDNVVVGTISVRSEFQYVCDSSTGWWRGLLAKFGRSRAFEEGLGARELKGWKGGGSRERSA